MTDTDIFLALSAAVGALVKLDPAHVRERARDIIPWAVVTVAIGAGATAESVRGFLYLLAMPIGLFVASHVAVGLMLAGWRRARS